jgi:hypothetical protein
MAAAKKMFALPSLCLMLLLLSGSALGLSSIRVKGTKLYDEDGNQFFVRGIVPLTPSSGS